MKDGLKDYIVNVLVKSDENKTGVIAAEQVEALKAMAKKNGDHVLDLLIRQGSVRPVDIARIKGRFFGSDFVELIEDGKVKNIPIKVIELVSKEEARFYRAVPIGFSGRSERVVKVAMFDVAALDARDVIAAILRPDHDIEIVVASQEDIDAALDRYYPVPGEDGVIHSMLKEDSETVDGADDGPG